MTRSIWIGFDPREVDAFSVAVSSTQRRLITPLPVRGVVLEPLRQDALYTREHGRSQDGILWDVISEAPMSTEFAISRFLTPILAQRLLAKSHRGTGWALFMDADVLVRENLENLFDQTDDRYAVMVVKHNFNPPEGAKMDGQVQTRYARKNWSSVMLFNCDHPANKALTVETINTLPGRDLHRFCWLKDDEIGELDPKWNFLVGHHDPETITPGIVHFTDGVPSMQGYRDVPFAGEWWSELYRKAVRP